MKIAVPTKNNRVDSHFGHCEAFTIFTVNDDNYITHTEVIPSTQECGCKSDIASVLQDKGVTAMLAGNMGQGAVNVLNHHGIEVFRGCAGDVRTIAEAYLFGQVGDSGKFCTHHVHDHTHEQN